jgi:hypothetical protein
MSARSPLVIHRDRVRAGQSRAYHVKKIRGKREVALDIYDGMGPEYFTPLLIKEIVLASIEQLMTNRIEQMEDGGQPDLFSDLDFMFSIRVGKKSALCELGDLGLEEIEQVTRQKKSNITAATNELDRWLRHCGVIRPLLESNPGWKWKDACAHLAASGGFPVI